MEMRMLKWLRERIPANLWAVSLFLLSKNHFSIRTSRKFFSMRTINDWLSEYGESHQNPTNKLVHWICVPAIFFSIVGLFYGIKLGVEVMPGLELNVAMILLALAVLYYLRLSPALSVGMLLFSALCLYLAQQIEATGLVLWQVCVAIFVAAWIGQFWGHKVEGKKPSFFKDLQFLLIGPAWLMSFVYGKLGVRY